MIFKRKEKMNCDCSRHYAKNKDKEQYNTFGEYSISVGMFTEVVIVSGTVEKQKNLSLMSRV